MCTSRFLLALLRSFEFIPGIVSADLTTIGVGMAPYDLLSILTGHTASVNALAFSEDGQYLASGSDDGIIFVFETTSWQDVHKIDGLSPVTALLWSAGLLYAGFGDGRLLCVDLYANPVRPDLR